MTKTELEIAQFLHHTATRAEALANKIDPKMQREAVSAIQLDSIGRTARYTFSMVVGRQVNEVSSVELNTKSPAPWTRTKKNAEGRRP